MSTHFKILIPVYNAESYIQNALISVMNQEYDNFECIITDDYSSDNTVDVVEAIFVHSNINLRGIFKKMILLTKMVVTIGMHTIRLLCFQ